MGRNTRPDDDLDQDIFALENEPIPDDFMNDLLGDMPPSQAASNKPNAGSDAKGEDKKRRSGGGRFLGMSPFQRMILSVFLFLDVLVLGTLILFAMGIVRF